MKTNKILYIRNIFIIISEKQLKMLYICRYRPCRTKFIANGFSQIV